MAAKKTSRKTPRKKTPKSKPSPKKSPVAKSPKPKLTAGKTTKRGTVTRLARRRTSKYGEIRESALKLRPSQELIVDVPKGMDSARFRNNLYHALRERRDDGYFIFSRSGDMKQILIAFEG